MYKEVQYMDDNLAGILPNLFPEYIEYCVKYKLMNR